MTCGYAIPPELAHVFSYTIAFATLVAGALIALGSIVAFERREASLSAAGLTAPFIAASEREI